jgi:hypothetical protein
MDLVQRTFKVCDEALQQANMIARDLGGVILVGGSTRLPVVRQAVSEYFQQEPRADVDPDEVVAMGAAIHAASLCSTGEQDSFLLDVTPLSLRIGVAGGLAEAVIERNTPVPIEQTRTFTTYQDFQESVKIRVFQGESRQAKENEMLGQFEFSGFKKARRGEVRIDVTFEINSDGIVNVTACDQETEQQASTQITLSSGLSEQEISQIIGEGRTERVRSSSADDDDSQAEAAASSPAPPLEEEPGEELALLPDAADSLGEAPDLEIDDEGEAAVTGAEAEEEEADPNAATQPDQEPPDIAAPAESAGEVEFEAEDLSRASAVENLEEIQPPGSVDGIPVDELDGSPDDEIEIQSGPRSYFGEGATDLPTTRSRSRVVREATSERVAAISLSATTSRSNRGLPGLAPTEIKALVGLMEELDYYQILEVPRDAPGSGIKRGYHAVSRRYHPDANRALEGEARRNLEVIAKRVTEAYSVLRDARRRRAYDGQLAQDGRAVRMQLAEANSQAEKKTREDHLGTTPNGRRFFALARADADRNDLGSAIRNLQMALTFEPANESFKQKLREWKGLPRR